MLFTLAPFELPPQRALGHAASGKTRLSVALCRRYGGEVLSCDSMQLYRGMDIGTAKPTAEEMQDVDVYKRQGPAGPGT